MATHEVINNTDKTESSGGNSREMDGEANLVVAQGGFAYAEVCTKANIDQS
ncbi:hypothetical protein J6590_039097 [Homalodisca vitripennis]|nr:hypothetical protein J6590_039097 [Homalodisca vitripennis]